MKKYRLILLCLTKKKHLQFLIVFELVIIFSITAFFSGIFFDRCQILNTFSDLLRDKGDRVFFTSDKWDDYDDYKKSTGNHYTDILTQLSNVKEVTQMGYCCQGSNEVYSIPDFIFDGMEKDTVEGQVKNSFVLPNPSGISTNSEIKIKGTIIKIDGVLKNEGYYFDLSSYKAKSGMEQFYQQFHGEQPCNVIFIKESYANKVNIRTQALENCFITYNQNITDEDLISNKSILQKYGIVNSYQEMKAFTISYTWNELNRFLPLVICMTIMCLLGVFGSVCIINASNSDLFSTCTLLGATPRQNHHIALAQFLSLIAIAILCTGCCFYVINWFRLLEPLGIVLNCRCFAIMGFVIFIVFIIFEIIYYIRCDKEK